MATRITELMSVKLVNLIRRNYKLLATGVSTVEKLLEIRKFLSGLLTEITEISLESLHSDR